MEFLKKKNLKNIFLSSNSKIQKAIKNLNLFGYQILLITNKQDQLLGTITDGDIRRGLLKGLRLEDPVKKIINYNVITTSNYRDKAHAEYLMNKNLISHLPVIKNNKILGMFTFKKIIQRINKVPVIIMAGGLGKRLLPLTKNCPKAMLPINDRPMLEHIIINLKKNNFKNIYISVNYLKDQILNYFEDGKKLDVSIKYIIEKKKLGTCGSLSLLNLNKVKSDIFIIVNCDILSDLDYSNLISYHKKNNSDATMVTRIFEMKNPYGVIKVKDNKIIELKEKPIEETYINAGIYVLSKKIISTVKKNRKLDMTTLFKKIIKKKKNKALVYPIFEKWAEIGSREVYNKLI
jgi:dTDP-glucose pyrophosphorylase